MSKSSDRAITARAPRRVMKPETFTIEFPGTTKSDGLTLQDAFAKYLASQKKCTKRKRRKKKRSKKKMDMLRAKFVEQALKYTGVPYAKRYFKEDEPEYQSPLFLDCCGLVRRVMYDLQEEFGFRIGPWNQAYMYDTLSKDCSGPEDMRPGDLIFIRGIFNNPNRRPQKHNITHVEIYMGDGDKSLGARWHRGKVQIFDTYYFDSTSYKIEEYIFKSLDPWLQGVCKSHCPEHKWKQRRVKPKNKYSIFIDPNANQENVSEVQQKLGELTVNSSDSSVVDEASSNSTSTSSRLDVCETTDGASNVDCEEGASESECEAADSEDI